MKRREAGTGVLDSVQSRSDSAEGIHDALERARSVLGGGYTDWNPLHQYKEIFTAYSVNLEQRVVVKHTSTQERDAMSLLKHQYLPQIHDFIPDPQSDDYGYLIMEDIRGVSLRRYIYDYGAVSQKQTFIWLRELAEAVSYLHSLGGQNAEKGGGTVIHCDIKPENILIVPGRVDAENHICLIDFDFAQTARRGKIRRWGKTPHYAAPEQYPDIFPAYRVLSQRTDIYAIGAVACFMLTGDDPEEPNPDSPRQVEAFLDQYDIEAGDILRRIIIRCMRHNPADRFPSAEKLKTLTDRGNLARLDRKIQALRIRRTASVTVCALGVLLSLFLIFYGHEARQSANIEEYNQLVVSAQQMTEERRDTDAEGILSAAIQMDPRRPEAYANLGKLLCEQGRFSEAETWMQELDMEGARILGTGEAERACAQVQYLLAVCWYQRGETADAGKAAGSEDWFAKALPAYEYAYTHYPESAAYCRDLAVCLARMGDFEKAEEKLSALRLLNSSPGDRELVEGEIACYRGRWAEGLDLLESALERTRNNTVINHASLIAADACRRLGEEHLLREIAILEDAVSRLGPMGYTAQLHLLVDSYVSLGEITRKDREYQQALDAYERLTARLSAETGTEAVFSLHTQMNASLALIRLSRFQEAEALLSDLQSAYDGDYRPAMRLALLYYQWELSKPENDRSYGMVRQWYGKAAALYAVSQNVDPEMAQLETIVSTLP